jgi:SAM-dependent methyltransferase
MSSRDDADRAAEAYARPRRDLVRETFERAHFARLVPELIRQSGGGRMLDLGCADGQAAGFAADCLDEYVGVDLMHHGPPPANGAFVRHDLREGLGRVAEADPFDVYLASFGVASHLRPAELTRLLGEIAGHGQPGAVVAVEALGLHSLEWPRLWSAPPGDARLIPYRLGREVTVHPWGAAELRRLFAEGGLEVTRVIDRTLQCGPKVGEGRYWPGLPPLRHALNALLEGDPTGATTLCAPLPPLPAHRAAGVHYGLAARRREVLGRLAGSDPRRLAHAVWALEPATGGGLGHGLLVVGRIGPPPSAR